MKIKQVVTCIAVVTTAIMIYQLNPLLFLPIGSLITSGIFWKTSSNHQISYKDTLCLSVPMLFFAMTLLPFFENHSFQLWGLMSAGLSIIYYILTNRLSLIFICKNGRQKAFMLLSFNAVFMIYTFFCIDKKMMATPIAIIAIAAFYNTFFAFYKWQKTKKSDTNQLAT